MFSETDIIKMIEFKIDTIFAMLVGVFFNRQSAFLWVLTVFPICFFIHTRQTSYMGFSRKMKASPTL